MFFAYKAKSTQQKKKIGKSSVNRRKPVKGNTNVQTYNDVRIFYRTPCNNSNEYVQVGKFINRYFDSEKEDYIWLQEDMTKVNKAIKRAVEHLNKALQDNLLKNKPIICKAIQDVIVVLQSPILKIYPLEQDYGQASEGKYEISINMKLLRDDIYAIAKTLIHEAFHIIGGCQGRTRDESCNNDDSKENAFARLSRKRGIRTMVADDFAQFIMQC